MLRAPGFSDWPQARCTGRMFPGNFPHDYRGVNCLPVLARISHHSSRQLPEASDRRIAPIRRIGTPHRDGAPPDGVPPDGAPRRSISAVVLWRRYAASQVTFTRSERSTVCRQCLRTLPTILGNFSFMKSITMLAGLSSSRRPRTSRSWFWKKRSRCWSPECAGNTLSSSRRERVASRNRRGDYRI
jgi:hypothetical protein